MPALTIGCSGFPVAQSRYFSHLKALETASTFFQPPRLATLERWRAVAPKDFVFTVKAWQLITHLGGSPSYRKLTEDLLPSQRDHCGHFQDTTEVKRAWAKTRECARALKARIIVFQTPSTFHAGADMLRHLYRFFQSTDREDFTFVWEPRGASWKEPLIKQVCEDLRLVHGVDPLQARPASPGLQYFRLSGTWKDKHLVSDHRFTEEELARLASSCRAKPTYAFFGNHPMFDDAVRFSRLTGAPV